MLQVSQLVRYPVNHRINQTLEMSTSINEFNDILNAEVHIDLDKLRESSRHGVPMEIRGVNISSFGLSFFFEKKNRSI